ncbi:hypothetical protein L1887_01915 [Cichorium endivia]|nr:hypothetical protein L1887_01915 [Cichorium endivia]
MSGDVGSLFKRALSFSLYNTPSVFLSAQLKVKKWNLCPFLQLKADPKIYPYHRPRLVLLLPPFMNL